MKLTAIENEVNSDRECIEASLYKMMDAHIFICEHPSFYYIPIHKKS